MKMVRLHNEYNEFRTEMNQNARERMASVDSGLNFGFQKCTIQDS